MYGRIYALHFHFPFFWSMPKQYLSRGTSKIKAKSQTTFHKFFNELPTEMIVLILRGLNFYELNKAKRVCKKWHALIIEKTNYASYQQLFVAILLQPSVTVVPAKNSNFGKKYYFKVKTRKDDFIEIIQLLNDQDLEINLMVLEQYDKHPISSGSYIFHAPYESKGSSLAGYDTVSLHSKSCHITHYSLARKCVDFYLSHSITLPEKDFLTDALKVINKNI